MEDKERKNKECPRSSILDFNLSWVLMFVYLGYLIGIYFAQRVTTDFVPNSYSQTPAYFLVCFIVGLVLTFLLYNLGKIIFAKVAGYEVIAIRLLGLFIDKSNGKAKVKYEILHFFDLQLTFAPKNDDIDKNPRLIFLGGYIAEAFIVAISLVLFFIFAYNKAVSFNTGFGWSILFAMLFGFLTPLYELLPFRQDSPTDMFNILVTNSKEDKIAYNVVSINKRRELKGEDFITHQFDSYESYYKCRVLLAEYLDNLYASRLEKAFKTLEEMRYFNKYYTDMDRYIAGEESVYMHYLIDDESGADQSYMAMKKDDKKEITSPELLSDYRTAILVAGFIASDSEMCKELATSFDNKVKEYGENPSRRVIKEIELFNSAYKKVKTKKEALNLADR